MKMIKAWKSLSLISPLFLTNGAFFGLLVSCSAEQYRSIGRIDGTDWTGRIQGSFAPTDYVIDYVNQTITYLNGISIRANNLRLPNYVQTDQGLYKIFLGPSCFRNNIRLSGTVWFNNFITEIPDLCFAGCSSITGFMFLQKPTKIGFGSFANIPLLSKITILNRGSVDTNWSSNLEIIDNFAFYDCVVLSSENIILGDKLTYIGDYAFSGCQLIKGVNMKFCTSLTKINNGAFSDSGITSVGLPPYLTSIGDDAFMGCQSLKSIEIYKSGMSFSLGQNAFFKCEQLSSCNDTFKITSMGPGCFASDTHLNLPIWYPEYELPYIPENAFSSCNHASLSFFPDGPSDVGDYAFAYNSNLNYLDFSAFSVTDGAPSWLGRHIFKGCSDNGGTILLSNHSVFTHDWMSFFERNDIDLNKWDIKTATHSPITYITDPSLKTYTIFLTPEKTGQLQIPNFMCSINEEIDASQLSAVFKLRNVDPSVHDEIKVQVSPSFDSASKTLCLTIDVSNATPHATYTAVATFYYGYQKIKSSHQQFTITIQ